MATVARASDTCGVGRRQRHEEIPWISLDSGDGYARIRTPGLLSDTRRRSQLSVPRGLTLGPQHSSTAVLPI